MSNNPWDKNRDKNRQKENDYTMRSYRLKEKKGGGKGPHRETCKANEKLLKLLAKVPIGKSGNVVFANMWYPIKCMAWYRPSEDAQ